MRKADLQQVLRDRGVAFASKTTVAELRSLLDEAEEVEESEETEDVAVDVEAVETKETVEKDKADDAVVEDDFGGALPVLQGSRRFEEVSVRHLPEKMRMKSLCVDRWMMEPINVEALEMAGSLRAFGQLGLREQVADMLTSHGVTFLKTGVRMQSKANSMPKTCKTRHTKQMSCKDPCKIMSCKTMQSHAHRANVMQKPCKIMPCQNRAA